MRTSSIVHLHNAKMVSASTFYFPLSRTPPLYMHALILLDSGFFLIVLCNIQLMCKWNFFQSFLLATSNNNNNEN